MVLQTMASSLLQRRRPMERRAGLCRPYAERGRPEQLRLAPPLLRRLPVWDTGQREGQGEGNQARADVRIFSLRLFCCILIIINLKIRQAEYIASA